MQEPGTAAADTAETSLLASSSRGGGCRKRNRGGQASELSDTAFRRAEKKYKLYPPSQRDARRPTGGGTTAAAAAATDLTDVVDFLHLDRNTAANRAMIHAVPLAGHQPTSTPAPCYTFAGVPGLLIFPGAISPAKQQRYCRDAVFAYGDARRHPNLLSTHAKDPRRTHCYQPPMRWATLGFGYQWTSKIYDRATHSPFPVALRDTMQRLIALVAGVSQDEWRVPTGVYQPQTVIVNYYPVGAMMMCHQDVSEEAMEQPLMSLSLGCSAVFLMGTESREDAPFALLLRSGDVVAFTGPARTALHATPRIIDDCPAYLTVPEVGETASDGTAAMTAEERGRYANYAYHARLIPDGSFDPVDPAAFSAGERERYWRLCMRHMRVNVNARQVYGDDCAFLYEDSLS